MHFPGRGQSSFFFAVAGFWVSVGVVVDDSIVVCLGYGCYVIHAAVADLQCVPIADFV